jgi:queuine tRNA-ribosyltransferase
MFSFDVLNKDGKARTGILETPHGKIETPNFVPVATKGALKGSNFNTAISSGAQIFMMNTFHFFCNERYKDVARFGGLHKFTSINSPIMTDSGGFQVFSLGSGWDSGIGKLNNNGLKKENKRKTFIDDDGVTFISPYNGNKLRMTPEISMKVQQKLGADIIFSFDECTSPLDSYEYTEKSLTRTHRWAERSIKSLKRKDQAMLGIVQGGPYLDLRDRSAKFIGSLPFFGFGIGGSFGGSYGDSKKSMNETLSKIIPILPENKPKHLLGIGELDDLIESVKQGVDLFDCVIPTRWARHGMAITSKGRINLKYGKLLKEKKPIDVKCDCPVCKKYSLSYIAHLLKEKEIYGISLLSEHNIYFILNLMRRMRDAIKEKKINSFKV